MKMKRIANDLALQTLGYYIRGEQEVEVYYHIDGYRKETIFKGKFFDFDKAHLMCLGNGECLSRNRVTRVGALDGVLQIGIDE